MDSSIKTLYSDYNYDSKICCTFVSMTVGCCTFVSMTVGSCTCVSMTVGFCTQSRYVKHSVYTAKVIALTGNARIHVTNTPTKNPLMPLEI